MFCQQCGEQVDYTTFNYCPSCGAALHEEIDKNLVNESLDAEGKTGEKAFSDHVKGAFLNATGRINSMLGEEENVKLNLRDVFSGVFQKHTKEEGEFLFIAGTTTTTPVKQDIPSSWPKPWLFSRVFLIFAITYALLSLAFFAFQNPRIIPGLIMVGSFAVPFSLLIFFWEMNAPRNISLYEIGKMLFIGGASSLLVTLFLSDLFPIYDPSIMSALLVGFVEETGKFAIAVYFIRKLDTSFILNGLLIGATIGAGFAAFETMGYALEFGVTDGLNSIIFKRAWMSVGAHVVWTAIAGAAFVYVKGDERVSSNHLFNEKFLKFFIVPVLFHALWNMPGYMINTNYFFIALIVAAWIFVITFIHAGLKQIERLQQMDDVPKNLK